MANGIFSALGAAYRAIVARLARDGVNVGTSAYPRVEVHTVVENPPLDKDGRVRSITCVVESVSDERMSDVMDMNEDNLALLLGEALGITEAWRIIGIQPGQLQQMTEPTETSAVLYRMLQNLTVYVEQI